MERIKGMFMIVPDFPGDTNAIDASKENDESRFNTIDPKENK